MSKIDTGVRGDFSIRFLLLFLPLRRPEISIAPTELYTFLSPLLDIAKEMALEWGNGVSSSNFRRASHGEYFFVLCER
jgi:hypothetical protein